MESILVIIAIIMVLVSASKKSKKIVQNKPGAAKPAAGTVPPVMEEWKKELGLGVPAKPIVFEGSASAEGRGKQSAHHQVVQPKVVPPEAPRQEHGGSMAYTSTEGVGSSAYQNVQPTVSEKQDPRFEKIDRKLPVNRLRAAIVMSEILDKPVALRGRR